MRKFIERLLTAAEESKAERSPAERMDVLAKQIHNLQVEAIKELCEPYLELRPQLIIDTNRIDLEVGGVIVGSVVTVWADTSVSVDMYRGQGAPAGVGRTR